MMQVQTNLAASLLPINNEIKTMIFKRTLVWSEKILSAIGSYIDYQTKVSYGYASQYKLETDYIGIAGSTNRISPLFQPQIDNCGGTSSFSVYKYGVLLKTNENLIRY